MARTKLRKSVNDDPITVAILPRPDIEEVHRQTVDRIGQMLATFADEVLAWCEAHPEAVEAEKLRLGEK